MLISNIFSSAQCVVSFPHLQQTHTLSLKKKNELTTINHLHCMLFTRDIEWDMFGFEWWHTLVCDQAYANKIKCEMTNCRFEQTTPTAVAATTKHHPNQIDVIKIVLWTLWYNKYSFFRPPSSSASLSSQYELSVTHTKPVRFFCSNQSEFVPWTLALDAACKGASINNQRNGTHRKIKSENADTLIIKRGRGRVVKKNSIFIIFEPKIISFFRVVDEWF